MRSAILFEQRVEGREQRQRQRHDADLRKNGADDPSREEPAAQFLHVPECPPVQDSRSQKARAHDLQDVKGQRLVQLAQPQEDDR